MASSTAECNFLELAKKERLIEISLSAGQIIKGSARQP